MIYYTGDTHGSARRIESFCKQMHLTKEDTIIILGDVAANYFGDERDAELKTAFSKLKPTILCIHGNHEMRPWSVSSYRTKEWHGGTVWFEGDFPNLLFAKDGEIYDIEGTKHLAIGGAYSVDKYFRLRFGHNWWKDEQPDEEIKRYVERQIREKEFDVILSYTCPFKYEPTECFLAGIDQSEVDASTEKWLDTIEETADYKAWYCGHWHIDKRIDRMHFLFRGFESNRDLDG